MQLTRPRVSVLLHPACYRCVRSRRGAGVLEVIIATLILSITVILLVAFFARGRVWFDHEEMKRVATLVAQDSMERTIALPYDQVIAWAQQRTISTVRYNIAVTVANNDPEANTKTIRSRVTWQATPAAQRNVTLATIVRRP
jgi:Tfp pilus assembly protein PilV